MAINLDQLVGFHQKALNIREERMEVISGNLANANTPGYKARDIDFKQAMESARSQQHHGSLNRTHVNQHAAHACTFFSQMPNIAFHQHVLANQTRSLQCLI